MKPLKSLKMNSKKQAANAACFLSVKQIYCEIQICGKGYPKQIRDLQISRKGADALEKDYHCHNNRDQKENPDECKQVRLHIKEYQAQTQAMKNNILKKMNANNIISVVEE